MFNSLTLRAMRLTASRWLSVASFNPSKPCRLPHVARACVVEKRRGGGGAKALPRGGGPITDKSVFLPSGGEKIRGPHPRHSRADDANVGGDLLRKWLTFGQVGGGHPY